MITPAEIKKKALRQYPTFLTAALNRQRFFPLHIKGNKGRANAPLQQLYPALRRLLESEKKKLGYGYTVTLKPVNTRHSGTISMPNEVFFANVEDYLKFIEKEEEFLAFRKAARQTRQQLPELQAWMAENILKVIKYLSIWENLLKVGVFFQKNPFPNKYARALPIDIPTTFIETQSAILSEVLEAILPPNAIHEGENIFEKRFGLCYDEPLISIRLLDEAQFFFHSDLNFITLSLSQWNQQEITAKKVFFILDKMNFLRFPNIPNSIALHFTKELLPAIVELDWLKGKKLFFWGDLSVASFQVLSKLRKSFSKIEPLLMDKDTFVKYSDFVEEKKEEQLGVLPFLNKEETEMLKILLKGKRILQKHILQKDLLNRLT